MTRSRTNQKGLAEVERQLAWWRGRYGGRGRPIPEELWSAAARVAGTLGVDATARALRLNRARLARRVEVSLPGEGTKQPLGRTCLVFVELETRQALPPRERGQVVVRLLERGGAEMEVSGCAVDVASVVAEFWRPSR